MGPPPRYLPPQKITKEIKLINELVKAFFLPLFISCLLSPLLTLPPRRSLRACVHLSSYIPVPISNSLLKSRPAPTQIRSPNPDSAAKIQPCVVLFPQFVDHWAGRFGRGDRVSRGALAAGLGIFLCQLGRGARSFCVSLDFRSSEVVGSVVAGEGGFFAGRHRFLRRRGGGAGGRAV